MVCDKHVINLFKCGLSAKHSIFALGPLIPGANTNIPGRYVTFLFVCLIVPVNNFSVMLRRVFLGGTSSKRGFICLVTQQWPCIILELILPLVL